MSTRRKVWESVNPVTLGATARFSMRSINGYENGRQKLFFLKKRKIHLTVLQEVVSLIKLLYSFLFLLLSEDLVVLIVNVVAQKNRNFEILSCQIIWSFVFKGLKRCIYYFVMAFKILCNVKKKYWDNL